MPDIVDPDQDRNNVRMQIDAVLFPAGKQIRHAVSADAAVQHLNIRAIQAQIRLDQAGIAASHKSAAVIAAAQTIRYGVALKWDSHIFLPIFEVACCHNIMRFL